MSTLKRLLVEKIESENLTIDDIDFVAVGGLGLNLNHFWQAANVECTIENIKDDFILVFKDGTWIGKHYSRSGEVRFKYHRHPIKPNVMLLHPKPQEFIDEPA